MYIIKNALRCIARSKGRNVLIGIIALVIAVSACIGLSIRQAAESAKESALDGLSVTATIQYNRKGAFENISGGFPDGGGGSFPGGGGGSFPGGSFNREDFAGIIGSSSSLTLEEHEKYAEAESVDLFYYTLTAYLNGSDSLLPVSEDAESDGDSSTGDTSLDDFLSGMGNMFGDIKSSGEFSVIGYSSDSAMTEFMNGNASITDGAMFDEGTDELVCVISDMLSMYNNNIAVGSTITLTNPDSSTEEYTLTVVGIYTSDESNDFSMSMFGTSQAPANHIYMSAAALQKILDTSEATASDTALDSTLSAIYSFEDADAYYAFTEEVYELGLDESYVVQSSDITSFENSIAPLTTLSTMAGWFLVVILIIGGVILVVLNIFNVRERKYEVGVLTAMGMKKWKVAAQFICEILVVTMLAVVIGAIIGAVSSVPVTNALLESQIASENSQQSQIEQNFGGRPVNMGGGFPGGNMPTDIPDMPGGGKKPLEDMLGGAADYISEVDSAMNLTVVFQMIGVGLLLTLVASAASVLFIMRYDPLKILANRD